MVLLSAFPFTCKFSIPHVVLFMHRLFPDVQWCNSSTMDFYMLLPNFYSKFRLFNQNQKRLKIYVFHDFPYVPYLYCSNGHILYPELFIIECHPWIWRQISMLYKESSPLFHASMNKINYVLLRNFIQLNPGYFFPVF